MVFQGRKKERGRHKGRPFPQIIAENSNYPLVTTGGGALPLPVAQPAMLKRANTAAVAIAIFFMEYIPLS
jgi:hypothetical protein